ncbi:MAG TPA: cytidine deaminase [Bacteroidales bacterium]|nr:cytidine deaminase [Bacteroidales bacterium]
MIERQICAKIVFCALEELPEIEKKLIETAKSASVNAYAPYSKFLVGAALLLENGEIIAGNNQENAAYPSGTCAERTAMFYANANYPDVPVLTMAVAAQNGNGFLKDPIAPCGSCRQVLLETEHRYGKPLRILLCGESSIAIIQTVKDLLPLSFGVESLKA